MELRVQLEDLTSVKKKIKVEVPSQIAEAEFSRVARDYKNHVRIPGFRSGKAPMELVKRRFRKDIRGDVLQKLIPESYQQAIQEKGVQPLGQPRLQELEFEEGKPLVYEAHFEVMPEIGLPAYQGLEVSAVSGEVSEEEVDSALEQLRAEHGSLQSIEDRPVADGDFAIVNLTGRYQDDEHPEVENEAISEEETTVKIGDPHTLEAFNEALRGMNVGEEKSFEVEYPADYPERKLAGRRIRFTALLTDVNQKILPDLNDDFARDLNLESLEQLRASMRQSLETHRRRNRENELRQRLIERLISLSEFEVPEVLIEDRIDEKLTDLAYNIASRGVDPSKANIDWRKVRGELAPDAEKDVRGRLILERIAQAEQVVAEDAELEREFERLSESMNQPVEKIRQYFQQENRMAKLRGQLRRQRVLDLLLQSARVTDVQQEEEPPAEL